MITHINTFRQEQQHVLELKIRIRRDQELEYKRRAEEKAKQRATSPNNILATSDVQLVLNDVDKEKSVILTPEPEGYLPLNTYKRSSITMESNFNPSTSSSSVPSPDSSRLNNNIEVSSNLTTSGYESFIPDDMKGKGEAWMLQEAIRQSMSIGVLRNSILLESAFLLSFSN